MHILILNTHLLHARFLQRAFRYKNMGADLCHHENLTQVWYGQYDAIVIPTRDIHSLQIPSLLKSIHALGNIPTLILGEKNLSPAEEKNLQSHHSPLKINGLGQPFETLHRALLEMIDGERRPDSTEPSRFQLGTLTIDLERHAVERDGINIQLRNKEFALLVCFLKNQGKVLSRTYLLEKVWDRNTSILSNTVDVHINRLRQKLKTPSERPLIETIPCLGYRFIAPHLKS